MKSCRRSVGEFSVDAGLVRQLIQAQFPAWSALTVQPLAESGWDNRTFKLGEDMLVRMPSGPAYAAQVEREHRWLPVLAPRLTQPIPEPLARGEPAFGFAWPWSVYRWLPGVRARPERITDLELFARDLAAFLCLLRDVPANGGPAAGAHNFFRGGSLAVYDSETRRAIDALAPRVNARAVTDVWETALASRWTAGPVWVHGDVGVDNLLVEHGRLCGVIDFGQCGIGDPACDLVPAWTLFDAASRAAFRGAVQMDSATWARGRGWALWKALIVAAQHTTSTAWEAGRCWATIESVWADHLGRACP